MAYNPSIYNPYGQTQPYSWGQPSQPMLTLQPTNGLVRVKGRQGAEAYPMGPNSVSPVLLDEDQDVFYIKRTDASGIGTVYDYDFAPRAHAEAQRAAEYATVDQLEELTERVDGLANALQQVAQPPKRTRKAADNGE